MKTAQFYILQQPLHSERYLFACRLVAKAYKQDLTVYIHTDFEQQAQLMDDRLWEFNPESFIPHGQCTQESADSADNKTSSPIVIGTNNQQAAQNQHCDLLVNLSAKLPDNFRQFNRIVEIANQDGSVLSTVRKHYAELKSAQFKMEIHDFSKQEK